MADTPPEEISEVAPLPADKLYRCAELDGLSFRTTAEITPLEGLVGQERALAAITVGTGVSRRGFNLFVIGGTGALTRKVVEGVLRSAAEARPAPSDWAYVNNFKDPNKPIAIALPAGRAPGLRDAMRALIEDLKAAIPAVFQSEEYQTRRGTIDEDFHKRQADAFIELQKRAAERSIVIVRTPMGFALMPAREGEAIPPDEFNALPEEQRAAIHQTIEQLEKELEHVIRRTPQWERERQEEIRRVNAETIEAAIEQPITELRQRIGDLPRVAEHIETVRSDLVENVALLIGAMGETEQGASPFMPGGPLDRYEVNVLVTQAGDGRAPVIEEPHPTVPNLTGAIEHVSRQGVLMTNFRLIKAGALHRANGGYLLLDARSVLTEAFAWSALKRALHRREIVIEDVTRLLGITGTVSLDPDPIPLDIKVVLFGDRLLYHVLSALDPDLDEHFKVIADFEDALVRSPESEAMLARLVATMLKREELRAMDAGGVGLVLEHAARLADDAGKLTLRLEDLRDILAEADFWASKANRDTIARQDVHKALDERIHRASRIRDRAQEQILDKVSLIDTEGERVGQINGLSVLQVGGFAFGRPTRITCQVRPGTGNVVDIEREVQLGGPLHSKGVLILAGFLSGHFALDTPMSLTASLVFEQSYGGVEGDSASSAELFALLSAIADIPLRQDLAVTGSVNQHGDIQAIGDANEKVEGFFDICNARGLTGRQGVLIPESNVRHLMLRDDVIDACRQGHFAVYPISTIHQGIALLTGRPAGTRGADGLYPLGSVYRAVEDRLRAFADVRRTFGRAPGGDNGEARP